MITYSTSKVIKCGYRDYLHSTHKTLNEVYKKHSLEKQMIYDRCLDICRMYKGRDFKIIKFNTYHFTCGFLRDVYSSNGRLMDTFFVYVTPSKIREISIYETV